MVISKAFWYFSQFGKSIVASTQETQGARGGKYGGVLFVIFIWNFLLSLDHPYFLNRDKVSDFGVKLEWNFKSCIQTLQIMQVGVMFASKAFVQLIANPFVGPLTNKYYNIISPINMETFALVDVLSYIKNVKISFSELDTASQCSVASS